MRIKKRLLALKKQQEAQTADASPSAAPERITVRDLLRSLESKPATVDAVVRFSHARCGKTATMLADALERASLGETVLLHGPNGKNVVMKPVTRVDPPAGDMFGPIV